MKNIDLKNIFKRKEKPVDMGSAMAYPVNFVRDWKIMVLCFAIGLLLISVFSWNIYLSNEIAGGYLSPEVVSTDVDVKAIDQKKLKSILLNLEARQADFLNIKANRSKLVDPSL